jgi:hypothetical protein
MFAVSGAVLGYIHTGVNAGCMLTIANGVCVRNVSEDATDEGLV